MTKVTRCYFVSPAYPTGKWLSLSDRLSINLSNQLIVESISRQATRAGATTSILWILKMMIATGPHGNETVQPPIPGTKLIKNEKAINIFKTYPSSQKAPSILRYEWPGFFHPYR